MLLWPIRLNLNSLNYILSVSTLYHSRRSFRSIRNLTIHFFIRLGHHHHTLLHNNNNHNYLTETRGLSASVQCKSVNVAPFPNEICTSRRTICAKNIYICAIWAILWRLSFVVCVSINNIKSIPSNILVLADRTRGGVNIRCLLRRPASVVTRALRANSPRRISTHRGIACVGEMCTFFFVRSVK